MDGRRFEHQQMLAEDFSCRPCFRNEERPHMTQHECNSCGATFDDVNDLQEHVEDEHGETTETKERQEGEKNPHDSETEGSEIATNASLLGEAAGGFSICSRTARPLP